jgi:hypothetical protein
VLILPALVSEQSSLHGSLLTLSHSPPRARPPAQRELPLRAAGSNRRGPDLVRAKCPEISLFQSLTMVI